MKFYIVLSVILAAQASLAQELEGGRMKTQHTRPDMEDMKTELNEIKTSQLRSSADLIEVNTNIAAVSNAVRNVSYGISGVDNAVRDVSDGISGVENAVKAVSNLIDSDEYKTELGAMSAKVYKFEPLYTGSQVNCHDCHSVSWMQSVISPASPVKCVRSMTGEPDACMDFAHNPNLIREIRCENCKYIVDGKNPGMPQMDPSTCDCWISKGEMVPGEGPVMRNKKTKQPVTNDWGIPIREKPKYQIIKNPNVPIKTSGPQSGQPKRMIEMVQTRESKGACRDGICKPTYEVKVTIAKCPLVKDENDQVKMNEITGQEERVCDHEHFKNACCLHKNCS